jgi:hypothetical protein
MFRRNIETRTQKFYEVKFPGEVAEWLKAHAWKACGQQCLKSSNLFLSASFADLNIKWSKMDFSKIWKKALKNTEIHRARISLLSTTKDTKVPYILLSESSINQGDTVVRKGEILVKKPALILPPDNPQFDGFDFQQEEGVENNLVNFLLIRGVSLPSLNYNNQTHSLDIYEGKLSDAIKENLTELQQKENVKTGLLTGPEDCWQFSLLIFMCAQIMKNANHDIQKLMDDYQKKGKGPLHEGF